MPIVFKKLFNKMNDKNLTTYKIRINNIVSESSLQKLRNNKAVSTDTIEKLCKELQCQPGDIMEFVDEIESK